MARPIKKVPHHTLAPYADVRLEPVRLGSRGEAHACALNRVTVMVMGQPVMDAKDIAPGVNWRGVSSNICA
jgi:hypothetical protein